jgi:hypothetical protein
MSCFLPNGQPADGLVPCNSTASASHCCRQGDVCLSNGFCFSAGLNALVRRGCTDKTFNSTECPQECSIGMVVTRFIYSNTTDTLLRRQRCNSRRHTDSLRYNLHILLRPRRSSAELLRHKKWNRSPCCCFRGTYPRSWRYCQCNGRSVKPATGYGNQCNLINYDIA